MKRYVAAYAVWLVALAAVGAIMLEWYRRIENIGWEEVATRLRGDITKPAPDDDET